MDSETTEKGSKVFYELCYRQYEFEMKETDQIYQRVSFVLVFLSLLGSIIFKLGRIDIFKQIFLRVDIFLYYLFIFLGIVFLASSVTFGILFILPRKGKYKTIASMLGNRTNVLDEYNFNNIYHHNNINQYTNIHTNYGMFTADVNYAYDSKGNLTTDYSTGNTYEYDWRNRLTKMSCDSSAMAEYAYDAFGRRISKTIDGQTTYYYYDNMGRVIAEYSGISESNEVSLVRTFVYGNGIDEVLAMFNPEEEEVAYDPNGALLLADFCESWLCDVNDGCFDSQFDYDDSNMINFKDFTAFTSNWTGSLYSPPTSEPETRWYYLHDALGSVMAVIGSKYNRESDREFHLYDVYGRPQGTEQSPSNNPYGFASYRYDNETGLYYLRARYYAPELGRFISIDPLAIVPNAVRPNYFYPVGQYQDGPNLYEYANSEPVMYTDSYGLKPYCCKINTTNTVPCPMCDPGHRYTTEKSCTQNTIYSDCKTPEVACCAAYQGQKNVSVYEAKDGKCKWCTIDLRFRYIRGWQRLNPFKSIIPAHASVTMQCDDGKYNSYISKYPLKDTPDSGELPDDEKYIRKEYGWVAASCSTSQEKAVSVYQEKVNTIQGWFRSGTCIGFSLSTFDDMCGCP